MFFLSLVVVGLLLWVAKLQSRVTDLEGREARQANKAVELAAKLDEMALALRQARAAAQPPAQPVPPAPATPVPPVRPPAPVPATQAPAAPGIAPAPAAPAPPGRPTPMPAARPPLEAPQPRPRPAPIPERPARKPFDWEELVGVRLFSWAAAVALAGAAVFFLGYSIQQGWLRPPVRLAIGIAVGVGLLAGCELKAARRYPVTANALDGASIAILFSSFFAAYRLWQLIGPFTAFALLALVTAMAVLLSIRRDSVFIALLGLVGGFATPALLSTGQDDPVSLFGYLLLLNAGLGWVAYRKRWPVLAAVSLVFTALYQWGWVATFMRPGRVPTASAIFLAFPLLGIAGLGLAGRAGLLEKAPGRGGKDWFEEVAGLNASLPLLFALYLATSQAYGNDPALMFGFLFVVDAGLLAIALWRGRSWLHALGALTTLVVMAAWTARVYGAGPAAAPSVAALLGFVTLFVAFYLASGLAARHGTRRLEGPGSLAVYAAPLLLFVFPVLAAAETAAASPGPAFAALFLAVAACAAFAIAEREGLVYFIAAFFAAAAEAAWSARYLSPDRLVAALTIDVAFGLLVVAVPVAARRSRRVLEPAWASQAIVVVSLAFLLPVAVQPSLGVPPWPMLAALFVLDAAIAAEALYSRRAEVLAVALGLSQAILVAWMAAAAVAPWPLVAMMAAAGVAAIGAAALALSGTRAVDSRARIGFFAAAVAPLLAGQILLVVGSLCAGSPGGATLALFQVLFVVALLTLATAAGWQALAVAASGLAGLAQLAYLATSAAWQQVMFLAAPVYIVFLAYPPWLGKRVGRDLSPHLAAVVASAAFFEAARASLTRGGFESVIGLLPLVQAGLLAALLYALLKLEPPADRTLGRLALVAGAVLALLTVAVPLQFHKEWLTIGWALEGAALAWLFGRIPHRGLFWWGVALLAAVFVRLVFNPEVLVYQARSAVRLFNWYLYTYLTCAAAMFAASWLFSKTPDRIAGRVTGTRLAAAGGAVVLFVLVNIEIADFFATGDRITFNLSAGLAQNLTYTIAWAIFAVATLAAGIALRSHAARVSAILLLTVALLKGFLSDVSRLPGLYRVASFAGLAICLALVAVVLQRFVLAPRRESPRGAGPRA